MTHHKTHHKKLAKKLSTPAEKDFERALARLRMPSWFRVNGQHRFDPFVPGPLSLLGGYYVTLEKYACATARDVTRVWRALA